MKCKILCSVLLGLLLQLQVGVLQLNAQCPGGTFAGVITPTVAWQTVPCFQSGEYYEFNAVVGNFYTFSTCFGGGFATYDTEITIMDNTGSFVAGGYDNDGCGSAAGESYLGYWTPPTTGTYRVHLTEFNCQASNICASFAYKSEYPMGSPGANCATPFNIPSLPFTSSGLSTCGFGNDFTTSNSPCNVAWIESEDFVFTYTSSGSECINIFTNYTYIYTGISIYDRCPSAAGAVCVASGDNLGAANPSLTNISLNTAGTYYIVVSGQSFVPCTAFDITVVGCPATGATGRTCATPYVVPSLPFSLSGFTTCGFGDDYDNTDQCGSNYMDGDDFVFEYVSPGSECIDIELNNTASWTGFFVLDGCPDSPTANCIASAEQFSGDPRLRNIPLVAAGSYYIVVSTSPTPQCTGFDIVIDSCALACSLNAPPDDNCSNATHIALQDSFCGISSALFSVDAPGNLGTEFCGSLDNNAWFSFVADSATVTIRFEVSGCLSQLGIQAQAYRTPDCLNFSSVSNCWNPLTQANGQLVCTGLTPGETIYLMIDGYAGDDCEYRGYVDGAQVPLPVEWGTVTARRQGDSEVSLFWETFNESNNRGFYVERGVIDESLNESLPIRFSKVAFIDGAINSDTRIEYSFTDQYQFTGEPVYYRIHQQDLDGFSDFSPIIEIRPEEPEESRLLKIFPNPASASVNLQVYLADDAPAEFFLYDLSGSLIMQRNLSSRSRGVVQQEFDLSEVPAGIYIYRLRMGNQSENGKLNIAK